MKRAATLLPRLFAAAALFALLILLRSVILDYIIGPAASVAWLIWRVLASVDQGTWWLLLVGLFLILPFTLIRSMRKDAWQEDSPKVSPDRLLQPYERWRSQIVDAASDTTSKQLLARRLRQLIVDAIVHVEQRNPLAVLEDLETNRFLLPAEVHTFLNPSKERHLNAREWLHRLLRQKKVDTCRVVAEALDWLQAYMEKKHEE